MCIRDSCQGAQHTNKPDLKNFSIHFCVVVRFSWMVTATKDKFGICYETCTCGSSMCNNQPVSYTHLHKPDIQLWARNLEPGRSSRRTIHTIVLLTGLMYVQPILQIVTPRRFKTNRKTKRWAFRVIHRRPPLTCMSEGPVLTHCNLPCPWLLPL